MQHKEEQTMKAQFIAAVAAVTFSATTAQAQPELNINAEFIDQVLQFYAMRMEDLAAARVGFTWSAMESCDSVPHDDSVVSRGIAEFAMATFDSFFQVGTASFVVLTQQLGKNRGCNVANHYLEEIMRPMAER